MKAESLISYSSVKDVVVVRRQNNRRNRRNRHRDNRRNNKKTTVTRKKPPPRRASWGIENSIHDKVPSVEALWTKYNLTGKGVKIAILDTGINTRHPNLTVYKSKDFTGSIYGVEDMIGHGSHCAGIAAGNNLYNYITGVAPDAQLYIGKVLDDTGSGTIASIEQGIEWAIAEKVDVISMSLGAEGVVAPIFAVPITKAIAAGIIVCVAAGNSGPYPSTVEAPGNFNACITVGAIDSTNTIAVFSSRGNQVDIVAPGVNILSTYSHGHKYAYLSGTSMATPFVAGIACLYTQYKKNQNNNNNDEILEIFRNQENFEIACKQYAHDLGDVGYDTSYGAGRINLDKMLL